MIKTLKKNRVIGEQDRFSSNIIFLISAIAGLIAVIVIRRNLAAEVFLFDYFGLLPKDIEVAKISLSELLFLFKTKPLFALVMFDFLDIINAGLVFILMLPVFWILHKKGSKIILLAAAMGLISFLLYCLSNSALFFLLAANSLDAAAREAMHFRWENKDIWNTVQDIGLFFFYSYCFLSAIILKRGRVFSKYTFWFGILANGIGLLYFLLLLVMPEYAFVLIAVSAPFTIMWHGNLSINLLRLWRQKKITIQDKL